MPKYNAGRKAKTRGRLTLLSLLILGLSIVYLAFAEKISPESALITLKSPTTTDKIHQLFQTASSDESLHDWAVVLAAREIEKRESEASALEFIGTNHVDANSAAGEELNLMRGRLIAEIGATKSNTEQTLQRDVTEFFRRPDLEPELIFLRGLTAQRAGKIKEALQFFVDLRSRFPTSPFSFKARKHSEKLRPNLISETQLQRDEVLLLAREGELSAARMLLDKLRNGVQPESDESYELRFTEEALLRKERNPLKADEYLLSISAEAPPRFAARALLMAAKNAWNENNSLRALELLDKIAMQYKDSSFLPEAHYIEGRILEELGKLSDAEKSYDKILNSSTDDLSKIRAAKRMAWISYLRTETQSGLTAVEKAIELSKSWATAPLNIRSDLQAEYLSSIFWKTRLLTLESASNQHTDKEKDRLLELVINLDPRGYYGTLSREFLGRSSSSALASESGECNIELTPPEGLSKRIAAFSQDELRGFAQAEIDYTFGRLESEVASSDLTSLLAVHSRLSGKSGRISSQVELAEKGLKFLRLQTVNDVNHCKPTLVRLAYPIPYRAVFQSLIRDKKLQLATILAISRTESFFRADALSTVGALGLMQLMPDTAKQHGWDGKTSLLDPGVNITLGAAHLAKLLNQYDGDLAKAAAAYNAGSAAVNRWLMRYGNYPRELFVEMIGYPETNKYVRRVLAAKEVYAALLLEETATK